MQLLLSNEKNKPEKTWKTMQKVRSKDLLNIHKMQVSKMVEIEKKSYIIEKINNTDKTEVFVLEITFLFIFLSIAINLQKQLVGGVL